MEEGLIVPEVEFQKSSDLPMVYVYNAPESAIDVRYNYHWEILRTALEKTKFKYGEFGMVKSQVMLESRQTFEMINATDALSVMYLGTTPKLERNLIGIHIPVDKNLGGYSIFLVRKELKDDFRNITTLDELKKFTFGLGLGRIDVGILQSNGFKVVTGSSYEGLFEMLVNKRFDIYLRESGEIFNELEERKTTLPDLCIEENVCLYYPRPMYFWFQKTAQGRMLAERAEEGMRMMIKDGTYDQIFDKYQQAKIEKLRLNARRIFTIRNPFLVPETPFENKQLWFDPKTYQPTRKTE